MEHFEFIIPFRKQFVSLMLLCSLALPLSAQSPDHYDASGKLYTVVACVAVIIVGIVLFLFYLERRIAKVEKEFDTLE